MIMQATYGYRTLTCEVKADKSISIHTAHPVNLHDDTISYAVQRFLSKSKSVCKQYVRESYEMRVSKGRGKKQKRFQVIAPAALADLGYGWLVIDICVTATGVTVKRIALLDRYPVK